MFKALLYIFGIAAMLLYSCQTQKKASTSPDPVIVQVGEHPVSLSEFKYVYEKNLGQQDSAYSEGSLREYLQLYTRFKLKVLDAESQGIDTTADFKAELAGYEEQLAKPYLKLKNVNEVLVRQAYERLKEEISASHILIRVSPEAEPKDTLTAYKRLQEIREKALQGESFALLAKKYSEDPSASYNEGALGYFTSLQMVYPFEQAAYNTPKGEISEILRTDFGYHILKVHDRRNTQGKRKVAHILIRTAKGESAADSVSHRQKAYEIYQQALKGGDWKTLCVQFSEDPGSKNQGGELPAFNVGTYINEFEQAAFALEKEGDISEPTYSIYGWHIIKLMEKVPFESFESLEPMLVQKVSKDSRSDVNKKSLLRKLKEENQLNVQQKVLEKVLATADSSLLQGQWRYQGEEKLRQENLLSFTHSPSQSSKAYKVQEFIAYAESKQAPRKDLRNPAHYLQVIFDKFVDDKTLEFEKQHLAQKYQEYKMLAREYREGMMLFQMMNDNVWARAIQDTAGARQYYENNKEKYFWKERVQAVIFDAANENVLKEVKNRKDAKSFEVVDFTLKPVQFDKNTADLPKEAVATLNSLVNYLLSETQVVVEIGGHIDPSEKAALSQARIKTVVEYLKLRGVPSTQIIQKDYGKYQPLSKTERKFNSRVGLQLYSSSLRALEKQINQKNPLNLKITEGIFQKGENPLVDALEWQEGSSTRPQNGRVVLVEIQSVQKPRPRSFEEARGYVIADYQQYLEQEWLRKLEQQNPIKINEVEFQKLIKKK